MAVRRPESRHPGQHGRGVGLGGFRFPDWAAGPSHGIARWPAAGTRTTACADRFAQAGGAPASHSGCAWRWPTGERRQKRCTASDLPSGSRSAGCRARAAGSRRHCAGSAAGARHRGSWRAGTPGHAAFDAALSWEGLVCPIGRAAWAGACPRSRGAGSGAWFSCLHLGRARTYAGAGGALPRWTGSPARTRSAQAGGRHPGFPAQGWRPRLTCRLHMSTLLQLR